MISAHADLHNFGQQVTLEDGPEGHSIYRKPRPIFWEWLFFGSNSPLRPVLSERQLAIHGRDGTGIEIESIAEVVMGLRVEFSDLKRGLGYSFAVGRTDQKQEDAAPRDLARFGVALAYCYAFGIQDVHYQNIIRTKERPQVIDAEVVLSKLILPDETILLPFGEHPWRRAGISQYVHAREAFSLDQARALIAGFTSALVELGRIAIPLLDAIQNDLESRPPIPIRVILRDTFRYHSGTVDSAEKPLMPEETEQSNRRDIPYFFKFLGSNNLYSYVSREGAYARAIVPTYFQDAVKRVAVAPAQLLDPKRLGTDLLATGLLQLCRSLLPPNWNGSLELGDPRVQVNADTLSVFLPSGAFQAKRKRTAVRA